jgi:hypothetical protein
VSTELRSAGSGTRISDLLASAEQLDRFTAESNCRQHHNGIRKQDSGLKVLGLLLAASLVLPSQACVAHYTAHPAALNQTDSAAYDALLIAETVYRSSESGESVRRT